MQEYTFLDKHLKIISFLVSIYPTYIRDDLRQELLMKLYEILTSKRNINNLDNYIFISLKNHAINFYQKECLHHHTSLNIKINENTELIDLIPDNMPHNNEYLYIKNKYHFFSNLLLKPKERKIIEDYFFNNIKQKDLSYKYKTSQQNISKIIKKAIKKIKDYIDKYN